MEARNEKSRPLIGDGLCGKKMARLLPGGLPSLAILYHLGKLIQAYEQHLCEVDGLRYVVGIRIFPVRPFVADLPDFCCPFHKGRSDKGALLGIGDLVNESPTLGSEADKSQLNGVARIGGRAGKLVRVASSENLLGRPVKLRNVLRRTIWSFGRPNGRIHRRSHSELEPSSFIAPFGDRLLFKHNTVFTISTSPEGHIQSPCTVFANEIHRNVVYSAVRTDGGNHEILFH